MSNRASADVERVAAATICDYTIDTLPGQGIPEGISALENNVVPRGLVSKVLIAS